MQFEEHCVRCQEVLGSRFEEVNRWMDEFHGHPIYKTKHRRVRHHKGGIEKVRERWGDEAAEAAKLHILDDLKTGEDENADESFIPLDEADYVFRGYW